MMRFAVGDRVWFHDHASYIVSADWDEYYSRPVYGVRAATGDTWTVFTGLSDQCLTPVGE